MLAIVVASIFVGGASGSALGESFSGAERTRGFAS
jgi:hypothetical protein